MLENIYEPVILRMGSASESGLISKAKRYKKLTSAIPRLLLVLHYAEVSLRLLGLVPSSTGILR